VNNITDSLGHSKACARWVPWSPTSVERGVFRFAIPLQGWWWKLFFMDRHCGWNTNPEPQTKRQSIEQYHPASWKKFKVTPSAGKVTVTVHRFFWGEEGGMPGDFGRHHAMWSNHNSDLYIHTLKTLQKCFRRSQPHKKFAEILLWHNNAWVWKQKKHSQNYDRLFFPIHHTAQILLPHISTSLESSKDAICGKRFGSDNNIIEEVKK
jgi:hypothetical protein